MVVQRAPWWFSEPLGLHDIGSANAEVPGDQAIEVSVGQQARHAAKSLASRPTR